MKDIFAEVQDCSRCALGQDPNRDEHRRMARDLCDLAGFEVELALSHNMAEQFGIVGEESLDPDIRRRIRFCAVSMVIGECEL
jgi:hypothetical protein